MSPKATLQAAAIAATMAVLGSIGSRAAESTAETLKVAGPGYTVVLTRGMQVLIPEESLSVELVEVRDGRCPKGVMCVWAGHATVRLKLGKAGLTTETVTIGTEAPTAMNLPYDATYDGYLLHLESLESSDSPAPSTPAPSPRATVRVTRR